MLGGGESLRAPATSLSRPCSSTLVSVKAAVIGAALVGSVTPAVDAALAGSRAVDTFVGSSASAAVDSLIGAVASKKEISNPSALPVASTPLVRSAALVAPQGGPAAHAPVKSGTMVEASTLPEEGPSNAALSINTSASASSPSIARVSISSSRLACLAPSWGGCVPSSASATSPVQVDSAGIKSCEAATAEFNAEGTRCSSSVLAGTTRAAASGASASLHGRVTGMIDDGGEVGLSGVSEQLDEFSERSITRGAEAGSALDGCRPRRGL